MIFFIKVYCLFSHLQKLWDYNNYGNYSFIVGMCLWLQWKKLSFQSFYYKTQKVMNVFRKKNIFFILWFLKCMCLTYSHKIKAIFIHYVHIYNVKITYNCMYIYLHIYSYIYVYIYMHIILKRILFPFLIL